MKISLPCIMIFAGIIFACKQTTIVEEEVSGLSVRYEADVKTGLPHGFLERRNSNDDLIERSNYRNGELHGTRVLYYSDGNPEIVENYENGTITGAYIVYYEDGNPEIEGQYVDGEMAGVWHRYYEAGNLMEEVTFKKNLENGPFVEYHENGNLKAEGQYYNGSNEHGLLKLYDPDGDLLRTMRCDSGICVTEWLRPDADTTTIQ